MRGRRARDDAPLPATRHEHVRVWLGSAIAVPFVIAIGAAVFISLDFRPSPLASMLLGWNVFGVVYAVLTVRAFAGASHVRLRRLVAGSRQSMSARFLAGGSDGPGLSVQFAATALIATALLPRVERFAPEAEATVFLTVMIVWSVVMSLVVVTLSYTVHYARLDVEHDGLAFPRTPEPTFTDYLYLAASVATTFGTTDVEVVATRLRRAVTGHSVVTFVFNSVTIALLVSALT